MIYDFKMVFSTYLCKIFNHSLVNLYYIVILCYSYITIIEFTQNVFINSESFLNLVYQSIQFPKSFIYLLSNFCFQ